jgi:hypothetical protein
VLAGAGRVVFAAQLTGGGITTANNDTIWFDDNGSKQILYRDGQTAPGMPGGVVFTQVRDPVADATGQVAFEANIGGPGVDATNSRALFSNAGGMLHAVARMGQSVPGIGTLGDTFYLNSIAGATTTFLASYGTPEGGYGEATFAERGGALRAIVQAGQPVPGIAGYLFNGYGLIHSVPGSERFVVQGSTYNLQSEHMGGVWIEDENYSLVPVLVGGTQIQLGNGTKTVQWVWMNEFNSKGELPLTVTFTDGTSALYIWNGQLSSLEVPGDYNRDGKVDAGDYTVWRNTLGSKSDLRANGNNAGASAGVIDEADFVVWKTQFGETVFTGVGAGLLAQVPEPASLSLGLLLMVSPFGRRRPRPRA